MIHNKDSGHTMIMNKIIELISNELIIIKN